MDSYSFKSIIRYYNDTGTKIIIRSITYNSVPKFFYKIHKFLWREGERVDGGFSVGLQGAVEVGGQEVVEEGGEAGGDGGGEAGPFFGGGGGGGTDAGVEGDAVPAAG